MHTSKASSKIACSYCNSCEFFNNPNLSAPELLLRKFYCLQAGCRHCVIYKRLTAGKSLPPGLCPDGEIKIGGTDSLS
jgi:hypothetical protein